MSHLVAGLAFPLGGDEAGAGIEVGTLSAEVWANDLIELVFEEAMSNNANLQNPSNYSIAPTAGGASLIISSVRTPNTPSATSIYLVVAGLVIGTEYTITASTSLVSAFGLALSSSANTAKFEGRLTKIDSAIKSFPSLYDMSPNSLIRNIVNAIFRQDDLLGGYRFDRLP